MFANFKFVVFFAQMSNRSKVTGESDSDFEELDHLLKQSAAQLKFIDAILKKNMGNWANASELVRI